METKNPIIEHLMKSAKLKEAVAANCCDALEGAIQTIEAAFVNGNKVLICGNGGSAADAQHMAAEFTGQLSKELIRPSLPAISLSVDTSFLTAYANDCGYDGVFRRQVEGLGRSGDVLIAITTSGESKSVLWAIEKARQMGITVIALTGKDGLALGEADVLIAVPSADTQFIQESHVTIEHIICLQVEQRLYGNSKRRIVCRANA